MKREFTFFINDILESIDSISDFISDMDYKNFADDDKTSSAVIRKIEMIRESNQEHPNFNY
ncbi:MAG: hypothetical protein M3R36_17365 [Bacteroidota bacterium]|nr:hypothetical protein [Bacteroidota bacterium]